MFDNIPTPNAVYARIGALLLLSVFSGLPAGAQPSQSPLLAAQSGAKPNLMISLDNSGSMAFNFHETYGVRINLNDLELRQNPANRWSNLTGAWIQVEWPIFITTIAVTIKTEHPPPAGRMSQYPNLRPGFWAHGRHNARQMSIRSITIRAPGTCLE